MSHILRTSTEHINAPLADEGNYAAVNYVASLEAHTILNTYNLYSIIDVHICISLS